MSLPHSPLACSSPGRERDGPAAVISIDPAYRRPLRQVGGVWADGVSDGVWADGGVVGVVGLYRLGFGTDPSFVMACPDCDRQTPNDL